MTRKAKKLIVESGNVSLTIVGEKILLEIDHCENNTELSSLNLEMDDLQSLIDSAKEAMEHFDLEIENERSEEGFLFSVSRDFDGEFKIRDENGEEICGTFEALEVVKEVISLVE